MSTLENNDNVKPIKKGKITMTIIMGIMCFILTLLIFIQVKTISQTDISELEVMKESELKTELTTLKSKYEEVLAKIKENNDKILEYENAAIEGKEASELLQKELKETEDLLGKNAVRGEGVIITLTNAGSKPVTADDLLELLNLLKNAEAEAISINEHRIVYDTYIANINNSNHITIKGEIAFAPFTVKAIGNTTYLESAVAQNKYGFIDTKISEGKQVSLERATNILIPAYNKNLNFEYVKEEK